MGGAHLPAEGAAMSGDDRRGELIDVALREFAEHGVEGTSMKALARKAGVSPALFYHYFRSKEELLILAVTRDSLAPHLRALLDPDHAATGVLPQMGRVLEQHLHERRHLVWLFLQECRTREAVQRRMADEREMLTAMISDYLEARVRAGELCCHDTRMAASAVLSLALGPYVMTSCEEGQAQWLIELLLGKLLVHSRPAREVADA